MKRPFAVIGFSMLVGSLLIINLSFKMTIALILGAIVIFFVFLLFKRLRKYGVIIFSLVAIVLYTVSFQFAQFHYYDAKENLQNTKEFTGVVCQTPTMSDYAFTYIVKCDENYKIRYVTKDDKFLLEGDRVKINFNTSEENFNDYFFECSLSSKVYFTVFENEETTIKPLNIKDGYYSNIGKIKNYFSSVVDDYLPSEAGAMAKAMTIGDRSQLNDRTVDYFNYSGTSHLLVISGLHITMWSLGILKILERFIKSKKLLVVLSLLTLLGYSAITGFGVSVIRASLLVGMVIISKLFDRDADSLNSIGLALVIILVSNPFAVYSVALWLTVLSTVGILVLSRPLNQFLQKFCEKKHIPTNGLISFIIDSVSISLSTTICTLPVFIVKLKLLPIGSIFANVIMVDIAMLLMVLTVTGAVLHLLSISFFARPIFIIVGVLSDFLTTVAQKIGMASWSTISVSHKYFEYFLVALVVGVILGVFLKKYNKNIVKHIAVVLSVTFVLLTCYTSSYDYNNPCVKIVFTDDKPVIIVKSEDKSLLIGTPKKQHLADVKVMLNNHNEKALDGIVVTDNGDEIISQLLAVYDNFGVAQTYFCENAPEIFKSHSYGFVDKITLNGKVMIDLYNPEKKIGISTKSKRMVFIECEDEEKIFEFAEKYDIIILYGKKSLKCLEIVKQSNPESEIIVSDVNKQMTIYIE
ncbi:MAG: ComEC/Rec2 family competence protein [Clostridia bacterium]|nr:ComEC/Rec2 family competence protein [Clostridia bacterium]